MAAAPTIFLTLISGVPESPPARATVPVTLPVKSPSKFVAFIVPVTLTEVDPRIALPLRSKVPPSLGEGSIKTEVIPATAALLILNPPVVT